VKLPALNDLIPEQRKVYLHAPDDSLFVAGPPGSGKTTVAVYRARYLADNEHSVTLVTRNRMLVALAKQLGDRRVQALTMHKFVRREYKARLREAPPTVFDPFTFDWEELLQRYRARKSAPAIGHLVVDEAQNLPPEFFSWARLTARHLNVFADEHQALDDEHSTLKVIRDRARLPEPVRLTMNHRNTPEIADLAAYFRGDGLLPPARVKKERGGELPRLIEIHSLDDLVPRVLTRFRNRQDSVGVIVRTGAEVLELSGLIRARARRGERIDAYTMKSPPGAEVRIKLVEPGVTVLTGESVIGLEFDAVYLLDLARSLPCRNATARRRMYMLCARARDALVLVNGPEKLDRAALAALPPKGYLTR
jgi:DNA helicase IV